MLKGLYLFVLVAVVYCQAKKCCFPQNWQLRQSSINAYANNKTKELQTVTADVYYDSVEKKTRQDIYLSTENVTLLALFDAHVGFRIINNQKCTLFEPGQFPSAPICIPDNWTRSDQYTLGFKPSINVIGYEHKGKVSTYVSVTDNCVPISIATLEFPSKDSMYLYSALFENYLPDVPDPSVFHVPAICKHALQDYKFTKELLHKQMFWREMFAKNRLDF